MRSSDRHRRSRLARSEKPSHMETKRLERSLLRGHPVMTVYVDEAQHITDAEFNEIFHLVPGPIYKHVMRGPEA